MTSERDRFHLTSSFQKFLQQFASTSSAVERLHLEKEKVHLSWKRKINYNLSERRTDEKNLGVHIAKLASWRFDQNQWMNQLQSNFLRVVNPAAAPAFPPERLVVGVELVAEGRRGGLRSCLPPGAARAYWRRRHLHCCAGAAPVAPVMAARRRRTQPDLLFSHRHRLFVVRKIKTLNKFPQKNRIF